MILACWAKAAGSFMWLIIRKPATSMPRSRALPMCCSAMSASVQWVAIRTDWTPRLRARSRSWIVPMPGSSSVVSRQFVRTPATSSSHSQSVCAPKP